MNNKIKTLIFGFIFFIAYFVIFSLAYSYIRNLTINEEKNRYRYIAINESNYISSIVDKVLVRTYTLREMVNENNGQTDFFEKVSPVIINSIKNDTGITVRNLLIAPGNIVAKVEPKTGNENLFGFDFSQEFYEGNKEALEANQKARTIITNPFPLIQGGIGISARTPVYIESNSEKLNPESYWGLVSATIDFEDLIRSFNFENFDKMHINYCLWYENDSGEKTILSSNNPLMEDGISEKVFINNLVWNLDLTPDTGWKNKYIEGLAKLIIIIISAILSGFILLTFKIHRDGNKMKTLAQEDNLTQCYSRYYLNSEMLNPETGNWKHPEKNYSVAIIDIDKFKYINDTFGHIAGDKALVRVAEILKMNIAKPDKDRIVRFGGDEFIIFFSNIERKTLRIKFQDILSAVEKIEFPEYEGLKLTISMGVAIPENLEDTSYKNMVKVADENLYKVKENGRNNYIM